MLKALKDKKLPPPTTQNHSSVEVATARSDSPADASILSRIGRAFRMLSKKRRILETQELIALDIAAHRGMTREYKTARAHGLSPIEALEDWDLLTPKLRALMHEVEETTT